MIAIEIPGWGRRQFAHLVMDFNGTLALDGALLPAVSDLLIDLSQRIRLHVMTADTFGTVVSTMGHHDVDLRILAPGAQDHQKAELIRELGPLRTAAVGNGRNDIMMLREATLGIGVIGPEGAHPGILTAADVICPDIVSALSLLLHPIRLVATLRV